jgi:hypothetical protein
MLLLLLIRRLDVKRFEPEMFDQGETRRRDYYSRGSTTDKPSLLVTRDDGMMGSEARCLAALPCGLRCSPSPLSGPTKQMYFISFHFISFHLNSVTPVPTSRPASVNVYLFIHLFVHLFNLGPQSGLIDARVNAGKVQIYPGGALYNRFHRQYHG